jgi:hypothetical protein
MIVFIVNQIKRNGHFSSQHMMLIAKTDQSFGNNDVHELMNSKKTEAIASHVMCHYDKWLDTRQ